MNLGIYFKNFSLNYEERKKKRLPNIYHAYIQGSIFGIRLLVKTSSLPTWSQQRLCFQQFQCPVTKNVWNDSETQVELCNIFSNNRLWISVDGTLCSANKHTLQATPGSTGPRENDFSSILKSTHIQTHWTCWHPLNRPTLGTYYLLPGVKALRCPPGRR